MQASGLVSRREIPIVMLLLLLAVRDGSSQAPEKPVYKTVSNISYIDADNPDEYARDRCKLDVYHPVGLKDFPTVVWFHGGGLKAGEKTIPAALREKGIAVVTVNYRLSPRAKSPAYIEDAAAAVAWTIKNIPKYGGAPNRIFVAGHSAGGYLTSMIGLDKRWLKPHGLDPDAIAGLVPFSGQAITHFTIRAERGIPEKQPVIDDLAPLFHVRADTPPILIISGDRNLELVGRYEETAYFWRMLRETGNKKCEILELQGYGHGDMADPAFPLLLRFIRQQVK